MSNDAQGTDHSTFDHVVGGPLRSVSMATWLALVVLVVTALSLMVASVLSLTTGDDASDDLGRQQVSSRGALKADQVERYFAFVRRNVAELAEGQQLVDASQRFSESFTQLAPIEPQALEVARAEVSTYYRETLAPDLEATLGVIVGWRTLLPETDPSLYLQHHYVVAPDSAGLDPADRRLLDDAGDGSPWSSVHREIHPRLLEISDRFQLHDLKIVEPQGGTIVYSVAKSPDFATSLDRGPYSGSTLASLVRAVRESPQSGVPSIADLSPYAPLVGQPVGFVAAPVFDDNRLVGVLVAEVASDTLSDITTTGGDWEDNGFGETGETYIVGPDGRMRTVSRAFVESPEDYVDVAGTLDVATEQELAAMVGSGTTAFFQKAVQADELGSPAPTDELNYLAQPVVSSVRPLEIEGLDWSLVSEITTAELEEPFVRFQRVTLIAVSLAVILIAFAAVAWAGRLFRPLRSMSERLRSLHDDGSDGPGGEPLANGPVEFNDLAASIEAMLDALRARSIELSAARARRLDTLRSLLPPGIAARVEAGDRESLDQIPQAGMVVLIVEGLGQLARLGTGEDRQGLLDRMIGELDHLAETHGLERVKIVGDAYLAGSGLTRPSLDPVPRAVRFALDAGDAVREVGREASIETDLAAGIDVGPVSLGLTGSARLVYDAWGGAVTNSQYLARSARKGEILLSDTARKLLPQDVNVDRWNDSDEPPVWQVSAGSPDDGVRA